MSISYAEVGTPEENNDPLGKGIFIDTGNQSDNLKMYAQSHVGHTYYGVDRPAVQTKSGFAGFYHHWHHYWNKTVGTKQSYIYSLKADYPISVGIIGENNPTSP